MTKRKAPDPRELVGLRKHAGGATVNTHATGQIDALTPTDIGAATAGSITFKTNRTSGNVANSTTLTTTQSIIGGSGRALSLLTLKGKITNSGDRQASAAFRLTYTDATTATAPTGTTDVANPTLITIPVWRDRGAEAAWAAPGLTEDLDDLDDLNTAFSFDGKKLSRIDFLTARNAVNGTAPTYECSMAAIEF